MGRTKGTANKVHHILQKKIMAIDYGSVENEEDKQNRTIKNTLLKYIAIIFFCNI
jgi:hypothetical protein